MRDTKYVLYISAEADGAMKKLFYKGGDFTVFRSDATEMDKHRAQLVKRDILENYDLLVEMVEA